MSAGCYWLGLKRIDLLLRVCVDRMVEPDDSSLLSPGCVNSSTVLVCQGSERSSKQTASSKIVLFAITFFNVVLYSREVTEFLARRPSLNF
jgi:hypothetical protein